MVDALYNPRSTALVLDLWATPIGMTNPRLPPSLPYARQAYDRSGPLQVPADGAHAFRRGTELACNFVYAYWWATGTGTLPTLRSPGTEIGSAFLGLASSAEWSAMIR